VSITGYPACPSTLPAGTSISMQWYFQYLDKNSATWVDNTCGTSTFAAEDGFISMNNISLTIDLATASRIFGSATASVAAAQSWWGMELRWFEDFPMTATIAATTSLSFTTVVQYGFQQGATPGVDGTWGTADDMPTWLWQSVLADYIQPANGAHPYSELSLYSSNTYVHTQCGSIYYGTQFSYDYRP